MRPYSFDDRILMTMVPVKPDPEFVSQLREKLQTRPSVTVETKKVYQGLLLVFSFSLFFLSLIFWLIRYLIRKSAQT